MGLRDAMGFSDPETLHTLSDGDRRRAKARSNLVKTMHKRRQQRRWVPQSIADFSWICTYSSQSHVVNVEKSIVDLLRHRATCASKETMEEELLWLKEHGLLRALNLTDHEGNTPCHLAVKSNNMGAYTAFLQCPQVDLCARDIYGCTPLDCAILRALEGNTEAVSQVCKVRPSWPSFECEISPEIKDMAILEVIKRAKWRESTAVATKLIKVDNMDNHDSGSIAREPGPPFEDTRDCIFDRGVFDAGINSKETTDDIIIFLRRKGYAKARDQLACATSNDGSQERERVSSCLLHSYAGCASKETMEEIISQLEKHGLSFLINTPDEGGRRPLHCATTSANMGALEALANCSAVDVNACDINGQTPLVSAVLEDELKVVAQLCKGLPQFASELMPNLKDTFGRTALDYAVDGNLTTIEMELMKREDVKAYVDGFYKERQLYVDKVNAILGLSSAMTGLIIAGTFGALLNSASDSGADLLLRKDPAMTSATICSFIFSIGASVAAVMSYNPKRRIGATVVYIRGTSQVAFMMLLLAGVFFFFALTLAGINMR